MNPNNMYRYLLVSKNKECLRINLWRKLGKPAKLYYFLIGMRIEKDSFLPKEVLPVGMRIENVS